MFTGIVQAQGEVRALQQVPFGVRLSIDRSGWTPPGGYEPAPGDSICVSGVCLTVTDADAHQLAFDVIAETLDRTTIGSLRVGDAVNLEPALLAGQPMGGHFLQGHVDGVGQTVDVHDDADQWRTTIRPPIDLMRYIVPKGSIAIDGVSLTIASVNANTFTVALIPTTLERTTLSETRKGRRVNLEADILAKTVVQYLEQLGLGARPGAGGAAEAAAPGVTLDLLKRAGFEAPPLGDAGAAS